MTQTRTTAPEPIYKPHTTFDLLRVQLLGGLLRWRWGRLVFQLLLLLVAGLILYDGFTGPQSAASNSATLLAWVHYRGLVILVLLLAGNFFCFGCPFTLPRTLARRLSLAGRRWPRALRNKWVSVAGLFVIFFLYEWLDLWASPWLTAWVAVGYFAGSFAMEALFAESPFCKYVCPLGAFNFVYATASPLQITARDLNMCRECEGKECVLGSETVPGCGTELFVPTMRSNMDCIFCLDCARACPYDNVALAARRPLAQLAEESWPRRWDLAFLVVAVTFMGVSNAFGMVPPVYALGGWLAETVGLTSDALRLLVIFGLLNLALPALTLTGVAWASRALGPEPDGRLRTVAARYTPAFVPLGLGVWLAHYGFHFAIGGLTIVPVLQSFLLDHGVAWLGAEPAWALGFLLPRAWIFPLQVGAMLAGFLASLNVLARQSRREGIAPLASLRELLPWAVVMLLLTVVSLMIFNLPMEMRGGPLIGG
jgi:polyferredoxin